MITENEYLKAVEIVKNYHQQIIDLILNITEKKVQVSKKVTCIKNSAGGHFLYFLTLGKEYDIILRKPRYEGDNMPERKFYIIDDNGKKRSYYFHNPQGIFSFSTEP